MVNTRLEAAMLKLGYQYGADEMENVSVGYEIGLEHLKEICMLVAEAVYEDSIEIAWYHSWRQKLEDIVNEELESYNGTTL